MKILRVYIKAWTASYRFPPFVTEVQPTLPVPPLSTIYGIISAVAGRLIGPKETSVGFVAPYKAKAKDLEKIYEISEGGKVEQTNVVNREFIYEPELYLYLANLSFESDFLNPRYPTLLGRSYDLAFIKEVKTIEIHPIDKVKFQYTLLPFPFEGIAEPIFALPVAFDDATPRRPLAVKGFYIIEKPVDVEGKNLFVDPQKGWGIFIHECIC
ncbi:MAG: type I-B CRISPR-associated protein Cas5 [Candidatus Bathyarchaeota archaeon]|nr:type I-B CRISPR-associated protein Cas5 [Candidatus Bathyarchaeota archaeon]